MIHQIDLRLLPAEAADPEKIKLAAARSLKIKPARIQAMVPQRRSIDARGARPKVMLRVAVYVDENPAAEPELRLNYRHPTSDKKVIIVGAGPAGYFAALELLELGLRPIVFDRGKDVQSRRRDLRLIVQEGIVNPNSNYCFGEGGAGTYSDGKLYTRADKRGDVRKVLKILVEHGAPSDILVDAHPHIGSNKLPKVVQAMRETILRHGGEVHFEARVTDFCLQDNRIYGVMVNGEHEHQADAVILATGHSARDIFTLLQQRGVLIEFKPFALGVRVEHSQSFIDKIQYGQNPREANLPPAAYQLTCQIGRRGVFSFCMCPGGWIVPSSTAPGELVMNGMSLSRRDSAFANSGIVMPVDWADLAAFQKHGPLAGLMFQQTVEQQMFLAGGGKTQCAPAQRLVDFVDHKLSRELGPTSYVPGIVAAPLHELLPTFIRDGLEAAFFEFDRKMKGYLTNAALMLAVESRTSSPVRIPRHAETRMHLQIQNLYPCGEGAGYAGGIVSAALDGQNVAQAIGKLF